MAATATEPNATQALERLDPRARSWVEASCGRDSRVVRVRRLRGGLASVIHELTVESKSGARRTLILRRVLLDEGMNDPAAEIDGERRALTLLAGRAKAPTIVSVDATGDSCGTPALLQTRLPGRPVVAPRDARAWTLGFAQALRQIAELRPTTSNLLQFRDTTYDTAFRPWFPPASSAPPRWSTSPNRWTATADSLRTALPDHGPTTFIHRDFHPYNVLFSRGVWSGTVDWVHGTIGPIEVDVSRCRVQIAYLTDSATADIFLDACRDLVADYDPQWDALVALELSPWTNVIAPVARAFGATISARQIQVTLDRFMTR